MADVPRVSIAPGYAISRLLKGGWQLAGGHGTIVRDNVFADMDRFVAAGVTTFDCADIYTGVEALIGEWLARQRGRDDRRQVHVHTKYVPDLDRLPAHSKGDVSRSVERSLARLGVERLDLVQLHWWDFDVPGYVEAASWLDQLRRAGKIRAIGLTNFDRQRVEEILGAGVPIASHQVQYSVLDQRPADGMSDLCTQHAISLLCYGAVAGGFLSHRYLRSSEPVPPFENRSLVKYRLIIQELGGWDRFQRMLACLDTVATRHHVGIGAVAIRWVLDRPGVAGVIVGARHARHLADIVSACALTLTDEDRADIARVQSEFAGPSGEVYGLERVKGGPHAAIMRYNVNQSTDVISQRGASPRVSK